MAKAVKCTVKMGDKIEPVPGSVKPNGYAFKGTCPKCNTPGVQLSIVGNYVRAHVIAAEEVAENNPQPATLVESPVKYGSGLREPVTDLTDTGLRVGDPNAAEQRRTVEIQAALGTATVRIPVKGEKGRAKLTEVPATEENIRKALAYWKGRKPRADKSRQEQRDMVAKLYRMLDAVRDGADRFKARTEDRASVLRGPALVPGRPTAPRVRDPKLPWSEPTDIRQNGEVRKATTIDQPRGRDRFDRKILEVPEPPKRRTPAERRRWRREQALKARLSRQSSGKRG